MQLYPIIASDIKQLPDRWKMVAFAQVDERFQPKNKDEINAKAILKSGLTEVLEEKKIPFFQIPQSGTLKNSSTLYNQTLSQLFSNCEKKLAVLGAGEDSHTAGLLAGYQKVWDVDRWVVGFANAGKYRQRITITPKAFAEIDYGLVVAMGEKKREALKKILTKSDNTQLNQSPANILSTIPQIDLFTDLHLD